MDKLTALKVFRAVAEAHSFARAADRMGLSRAAVSKNISELEAGLNTRLFHRTTRQISLTEAGLIYFDRIGHILDELETADWAIEQLNDGPVGLLRVAAPHSFSLLCLLKMVPGFLAAYPDINLQLDMDDRKVNIVDGSYDLAIRGSNHLEDSSLIARKLTDLPHTVCAAPSYLASRGTPLIPADIVRHQCLSYSLSDRSGEWIFSKDGDTARIPINSRFAATSSIAVRQAVVEGLGMGLLPNAYIREELADGRIVRILDDWKTPTASIYAIYASRRHIPLKLRVFLDFLAKFLEDKTGAEA